MLWLWLKWMKNSISSYSLPLCLSHGTRRTNLSPQDQAKYKLSSDQAQVHVSSPSLCVLESPFTGFSSSTTPTSSKNTKSNSHQHDKKKIIWSNMYHKKINIVVGNWSHILYHQFKILIHDTSFQWTILFDITYLSIHMQVIQIVCLSDGYYWHSDK